MSGSQIFFKLSERAVEDHGVIHFHLDQLERALSDLDPASATDEALRTVAVRIDSFKERLAEHFGTEEDGGLLQGIQDALPQAESDVRRLRAQHARLEEALDKARAIARRGDPAEAPVLKTELDRFLAMMREHERDEEALLKRALRQNEC
jgi:DNA repair exonuclease SbcCD ATPase subunit